MCAAKQRDFHACCVPIQHISLFNEARVAARAARWYAGACTTELRALAVNDPPLCVPRLDAWYLGTAMRRWAWGSPAWRGYFAVRRAIRRVRAVLS